MSTRPQTTDRLLLRAPCNADEPHYRHLLLDRDVGRWLRPPPLAPILDPEPALWLARDMAHWRDHAFGPWVLLDRQDGQFIGRCGLNQTTLQGTASVELTWALLPERWGSGIATEAAMAAMIWARELGIDQLVSFTLPENLPSRRVMEKAGLRFVGVIVRANIEHVLYRADAQSGLSER